MTPETLAAVDRAAAAVLPSFKGGERVPDPVFDRVMECHRAYTSAEPRERLDALAAFVREVGPAAVAREPWCASSERRQTFTAAAYAAADGLREVAA